MEELVLLIKKHMIDDCVDLYMETFTKEPWNDIYESREQVYSLFLLEVRAVMGILY